MPLDRFEDGQQRYRFCKAVEDAFRDIERLKRVVSFGLNQNLNAIAGNNNLEYAVFNLVEWAESNGKLPQLIQSVCNHEYGIPGNPQLKPFCQECSRSQLVKESAEQQSQPAPKPPIQEKPQPKPITPPEEDDLRSEKGVDYTRLRDLLKAGKWKEADEETLTVMLKAAGREKEGWLNSDSIEKFPCTDLRTIDQLWVKYSKGRFGFTVQKRIWESVERDYKKLGDCVGWRRGMWLDKKWLNYNKLTFCQTVPQGYLPLNVWFGRGWELWHGWFDDSNNGVFLLSRQDL